MSTQGDALLAALDAYLATNRSLFDVLPANRSVMEKLNVFTEMIDVRLTAIDTRLTTVDARLTAVEESLDDPPPPPPAGPLTLSGMTIAAITTTTARLSVVISGEIPDDALMLIQWTTDINAGPWYSSDEPTDAAVGEFAFDATGLTVGTTYYCRASIYTEGPPTVIHAVTSLASFATLAVTGSAPSYSRMVNEMDWASEGRAMRWVSWANNPGNVQFVGGPSGKPCPAVIAAGALPRGSTVSSYTGVPAQYLGSAPWPLYSPWIVVLEEADLATGLVRLHTEDNCGIQIERAIFDVYRDSFSAWQTIRDRNDQVTLFLADEANLLAELAHTAIQTRAPTPSEGAGIVVRVPKGSGDAIHHTFVKGPIGFPLSTWENGIDLSSIVTDIRCLAVAYLIRAVPWNPNAPFNPANVRLMMHIGSDARVVDPHPWGMPPHVLTRQRRVLTTWDWYTGITLRDTIRSDRQDAGSPSVEAGFTKAEALARPIPGWAA